MVRRALGAAIGLLFALTAFPAAAQNAVPSCYAAAHINAASPPPVRAVFLFVDRTTAYDADLTATIRQNMQRLVRPGVSFVVASFADFQHFPVILAAGTLEQTVPGPQRSSVSTAGLQRLDTCLRRQIAFGVRVALSAFDRATATSTASFSQSEIMSSLKHLSARVAAPRVVDRIVIVASDMIEHSSGAGGTSFYRNRALRLINPAAEIGLADHLHLFGNFARARIYVVGAGVLPPQPGGNGRTIPALNALEAFWREWFRRSNGRLIAFGHPDLAVPIQ